MATESESDKDKARGKQVNPTGTPDRGGMSEADKTLEKYRQWEKGIRPPAPLADKKFLQGQGDISELPEAPPLPTQGALRQLQEDSGAQPGPPSPRLQRSRRGIQDKAVNYAQQLRHERVLRGWTQQQLAEKIGAPVSEVQGWESNLYGPGVSFRQKLAELFGNDFYLSEESQMQKEVRREEDERAKSVQQPTSHRSDQGLREAPGDTRSPASEQAPVPPQRPVPRTTFEPAPEFPEDLEGAIEGLSLTTQGETVARDVAGRQPQANEQPTQDRQESSKAPVNYGLQLQRERKRKGWTQERLANMIGVPASEITSWEKNLSSPDRLSRRKLAERLGRDIYHSSIVRGKDSSSASRVDGALQVRLTQEPLTAQNFTSIISALTELYTKAWLIEQGRFSDLVNYAQTHDSRFTKEANLVIGKLAHDSPALIELLLSPAVLAATATVALALKTGIDAIVQTPLRFKAAELENQQKELEMKIRGEEAQQTHQTATQKDQLELMQRKLEIEMQRLEVGKKRVETALETASKMVETLRPGIDKETKGMLVQALLPNLLQLDHAEGLQLALPAPQSS